MYMQLFRKLIFFLRKNFFKNMYYIFFQVLGCSTDSLETHSAWTTSSHDEHGLNISSLPFPLLADHSQALTRKFDLLDSNQGSAKNALLLMDPKGLIRHSALKSRKKCNYLKGSLLQHHEPQRL